jgi:ligand-binding sensor domain-containing protein
LFRPPGSKAFFQWKNRTCMPQCVDNDVYSLSSGDNGKLFAGTSHGIFWADEFDTGQWYEIHPQLKTWPVRHQWVTYDSVMRQREIFASTDSGVYLLSPRVNQGRWTLSLNVKAFGVASLTANTPNAWFAATSDGVWKYEQSTALIRKKDIHAVSSSRTAFMNAYTLDGRRITSTARLKSIPGVYVTLQQTGQGSHGKVVFRLTKRQSVR